MERVSTKAEPRAFQRLLFGGNDLSRFTALAWGRSPVLLRQCSVPDLFSLREFGDVLAQAAPYATQAVRISRAKDASDDNRRDLELAVSPADARQALSAGRCITVNRLERFVPRNHALALIHADLCLLAGTGPDAVQIAAFHSPAQTRAFGRHADRNHIFVVQIEGSKKWELGPEGQCESYELQKGDLLYVPYGVEHAVQAGEVASLSLTFILRMPTWREVAVEALLHRLDECCNDALSAPSPLPLGWLQSLGTDDGVLPRDLRDAFAMAGLGSREWLAGAKHLALQNLPSMSPEAELEITSSLHVEADTPLTAAWSQPLVVLDSLRTIRVAAPGLPQLLLPATLAPAMDFVQQASEVFKAYELPDVYDDDTKLLIARRLVQAGYLLVARTPVGVIP